MGNSTNAKNQVLSALDVDGSRRMTITRETYLIAMSAGDGSGMSELECIQALFDLDLPGRRVISVEERPQGGYLVSYTLKKADPDFVGMTETETLQNRIEEYKLQRGLTGNVDLRVKLTRLIGETEEKLAQNGD